MLELHPWWSLPSITGGRDAIPVAMGGTSPELVGYDDNGGEGTVLCQWGSVWICLLASRSMCISLLASSAREEEDTGGGANPTGAHK